MNKKKIISYRASEEDVAIIERFKEKEGSDIRKLTDADVIRFALSLIGKNKKTIPSIESTYAVDKKFEIIEGIPHIGGVPQAVHTTGEIPENHSEDIAKEDSLHEFYGMNDEDCLTKYGMTKAEIEKTITGTLTAEDLWTMEKRAANSVPHETSPELTPEELQKGYQYIKGELCDMDGFPVEQDGNMVIRNGEVYATEPKRSELKEQAAENISKHVTETPIGKMNDAMANILGDSEKLKKHFQPGMLTQEDGVDEEPGEFHEDFIG